MISNATELQYENLNNLVEHLMSSKAFALGCVSDTIREMNLRGYRLITPEEFRSAMTREDCFIHLWIPINSAPDTVAPVQELDVNRQEMGGDNVLTHVRVFENCKYVLKPSRLPAGHVLMSGVTFPTE